MPPIPIPPPYGGQNDQVPLVALQPPFAESVVNFNLDDGNAKLRRGDSLQSDVLGPTAGAFCLSPYGSSLFIVYRPFVGDIRVRNMTSAPSSDAYVPGGAGTDTEIHSLYFNRYLTFFGDSTWKPGAVGNPRFDGATWGLSGWTFPASSIPFGGGVYKNRAYMILKDSAKYVYTGINAISGATTEVDLAQVVSRESKLVAIRSVSLADGVNAEILLCFIFDSGEVLAYSGSYPDSATWQIARRFFIPQPIGYNSMVEANGDVFVLTWSGPISLRTLLTQGENIAVDSGFSSPIRNRWEQIVKSTSAANRKLVRAAFDKRNQRLVVSVPNWISRSGAVVPNQAMRLIYSFKTASWFEQRSIVSDDDIVTDGLAVDIADWNNSVTILSYHGIGVMTTKMEESSEYRDVSLPNALGVVYPYELISAPVSNGRAFVQMCGGLDVIMKSDLYSQTDFSLISDLGVRTSEVQKIPDQGTGLQKPFVNVGIEGSYIQYKISGTTAASKSVGLELYGFNFYQDNGASPR